LQALRSAPSVGRLIVVAPPAARQRPELELADEFRADGVRIKESLQNGLDGLPPNDDVLISTSDLPILNAIAIEDFIGRAVAMDADLTYGCVEKQVHLAQFAQVPHTWARLADGTYCGAGFVTIKPRIFPQLAQFIERLGHARKNPLALASLFGWGILFQFATRTLTIARAERRASTLIGARVRAVVSPYPEIAVNVDRLSDIPLAQELVRAAIFSGNSSG
ncbi:MAG: hypothetical protein M3Y21_10945, partial [Candidatus Eremiobacteraeota bacterium]|nr:hypothetical protein [Candidatus Eremiobacteraeota bacterium]